MLNPPDKIYLQFYGDQEPPNEPTEVGDVSWCEDLIWKHDILYLRADELKNLKKQLKKALDLLTLCRDNPAHMQMSIRNDIQDFLNHNIKVSL
jgi:hypothetical protein